MAGSESMGPYSEYIAKNFSRKELAKERKNQLRRISQLRGGRDVLVYAADLSQNTKGLTTAMEYSDIALVQDQLSNLHGKELDVLIETPGGAAEVAEDIIRLIRQRYERIGMIVPGWAKSAGTIFVMAGDEILMGAASALGPIDPQILFGGKRFSADAFLEGLDKMKAEVSQSGSLNPAYIPILQGISPGEVQSARNAQQFSRKLVTDWLVEYKFKYWETHSSTGKPVTMEEKRARAGEIATALSNHSHWLTHGRSVKISDLDTLRLKVTDYSGSSELNDAISRYHALMRMTFDSYSIYKLCETPGSAIEKQFAQNATSTPAAPAAQNVGPDLPPGTVANGADAKVPCLKCTEVANLQINLEKHREIKPGFHPYPVGTDVFKCPKCGEEQNLLPLRQQLESSSNKKIVP